MRYLGGEDLAQRNRHQTEDGWMGLFVFPGTGIAHHCRLRVSSESIWSFIVAPILLEVEKKLPVMFKYKPRGKASLS